VPACVSRNLRRTTHEVDYVLVGAVAMIVHGIVRTTSDVDLFVRPEADVPMDILSRLGTALRYEDLESQVIRFAGIPVTVATPRQLHRMKKDTVRLQDRADAEALREHFGLEGD
jgi:tRNA nucleotidyltransferase (CCA-adding enzyme)